MVVMQPKLQREDLVVGYQERAKQQEVLRVLNTVIRWAHWIYGVPEIVIESVEILFTETDPYLREKDTKGLLGYEYRRPILQRGELLIEALS